MSKVLIIGAGIAGLTAGIYGQKRGHSTLICERGTTAGGNLTGWQRGEYHIDNCIHWLTGTNPSSQLYRLWRDIGALGDVNVLKPPSLYTYEKNGKRLSLTRSLDELEWNMLTISPEDRREIKALISAVRAVQGIDGVAGRAANEELSVTGKLFALPKLIKYHSMTTGALADRFKSPLIRGFITAILTDSFSAMALITVIATFTSENGDIPEGGSSAMARRVTDKYHSLGGKLLLNKEAVKINLCGRRAVSVSFSDGSEESADYVIITADPATVFGKMLDRSMPKALKAMYDDSQMRRFSAYHTAFACESASLPFSGDFIFELPLEYRDILHTDNLIMREFSHERSYAPEGRNIIQTLTFCTEDEARDFIRLRESREEYEERKRLICDTVERAITEKFPELSGKLECLDCWTPATYKRYVNSEIGSFMSFLLPPSHNPFGVSGRVDGLDNVLLATQWLKAPGGLPIAATLGREAALAVVE